MKSHTSKTIQRYYSKRFVYCFILFNLFVSLYGCEDTEKVRIQKTLSYNNDLEVKVKELFNNKDIPINY